MYAFEVLVRRYQNMVYNICFRFTGEAHEAFDCAQDTFIKVYQNIKSFKHLSSFKTWIYRVTVNICKNRVLSRQYRMRKSAYGSELTVNVEDYSNSPAVSYEKKRLQELVQCAIDKLPFDHKQVIILRDIQQLSYEEIEKITGLSSGTVKSKIARARNRLKELLRNLKK